MPRYIGELNHILSGMARTKQKLFSDKAVPREGIEISPQMVFAGVEVFVRYDPSGDLAAETVAEIYRAMAETGMRLARPKGL